MQAHPTAGHDPAGRLFDEARRRLRSGELGVDELQGLAARVETLAAGLDGEAQRLEMRTAARALRDLPDLLASEAVYGSLASSGVLAELDRLVEWAWEPQPSTELAVRRARAALGRVDRLQPGTREEARVLRAARADLSDRVAALQGRRS